MSRRPERLQALRALYGWTQLELCKHLAPAGYDLTQYRLSRMENGLVEVDDHLVAAACAVSGLAPSWFETDTPLLDGSLKFRRLKSRTTAVTTRQVERLFAELHRAFNTLASAARLAAPELPIADGDDLVDAAAVERLAEQTREAVGVIASDPVPHVTRICERARIGVVPLVVPGNGTDPVPGHMGVSAWRGPWDNPLIGYFPTEIGDRQRFTIAHELGHLVLHSARCPPDAVAEDEANRFAGAFLLPHERAMEAFRSGPLTLSRLQALKAGWGMAIAAMIMRAQHLGIIDAERTRSLFQQMSMRGWRTVEPVTVHVEHPLLARKLVDARYRGDLRRAADDLGISESLLAAAMGDPVVPRTSAHPHE